MSPPSEYFKRHPVGYNRLNLVLIILNFSRALALSPCYKLKHAPVKPIPNSTLLVEELLHNLNLNPSTICTVQAASQKS